jgi:hypothetical protein
MITSGSYALKRKSFQRHELAAGSDPQATAELEGWAVVSH